MRMATVIAVIIIVLFYLPMFKWFSDSVVDFHSLGLTLYWVILTLLSIIIGFKMLGRTVGEAK